MDEHDLVSRLRDADRLLVITGAGCSTASGIGDYRDADGAWKRARPVQHADFMTSPAWRRRYWARSQKGYPEFRRAVPNGAHLVLADWERQGRLAGLITQNVDQLHQRAGHHAVIDLHGRLDRVVCMGCGALSSRAGLQVWLEQRNPQLEGAVFAAGPDGDADLEREDFSTIRVPDCRDCGGILKPDVVFYGASVPRPVVEQACAWVDAADAVLVVGSSLMVYSSFRFVRRASEQGKPVMAVNMGRTRADDLLCAKVAADCAGVLGRLDAALA